MWVRNVTRDDTGKFFNGQIISDLNAWLRTYNMTPNLVENY